MFILKLDKRVEFCCLLCRSDMEATPHSSSTAEEKPAASEESEDSEVEEKLNPAAGQAESTAGKKKRKRKRKRKKTKAATVE